MKHKKLVTPAAVAAIAHGLCPAETGGHEHVPSEIKFDPYAGAGKTAVMDTSAVVAGLPLVDLAKLVLPVTRPKAKRSR
jgi:hypothetical protein